MRLWDILTLVFLFSLLACVPHPARNLVDVEIPLADVERVIRRDCDLGTNPLHCKHTQVTYRAGTETVILKKH